jgi:ribonuclease Z
MKVLPLKIFFTIFLFLLCISQAQDNSQPNSKTQIILLGTGNPNPDPAHSGCSVAIVVDNTPYIVDFGPGVVRRAAAVSTEFGGPVKALNTENIKHAFLTHLHSDHTVGLPDLIFTPWVMGRNEPLQLYGPEGTKEMADYILKAYRADIDYRLYGLEPANNIGWRVMTHEFEQGMVYKDNNITVDAFAVNHGTWPNAYGFCITTADKKIVISGDCAPSENVIKYSKGADVLIHEVYYQKGFEKKPLNWKSYHKSHHTSTYELADIARQAKPNLVILYHILYWGATDQDLLAEIAEQYAGKVIVGRDLMIID